MQKNANSSEPFGTKTGTSAPLSAPQIGNKDCCHF
jgi:hypothetical protein